MLNLVKTGMAYSMYIKLPSKVLHMGARRGGKGGTCPPPLEFEKMTSYAAVLQNTLKFSLAPSALAIDTLYFSLKCREKRKNFRLRFRRAENVSIFKVSVDFCPPLEKFLRAPILSMSTCRATGGF